MSSEWDETCLVCCTKTKNRCSRCAEAGISLYFCSPEHQRLVWNDHKRVCGPGKANPFVWPLLSVDESREVIEHMDETTGNLVNNPPDLNTVAKMVAKMVRSREMVPMLIEELTAGADRRVAAANDARQQLLLVSIRAFDEARVTIPVEAQSFDNVMGPRRSSALCAASGWDFFAARGSISFDEYGREPWRTKARHYALINFAMTTMAVNGYDEAFMTLDQSLQRLTDHVVAGAARSNPRFAAEYRAAADRDLKRAQDWLRMKTNS
ncbi:uncharacterized protein RHOBADRAFT_66355 [Rhodotorula graminis WP1]|uniref:Uncharacterized protein n=1 Tax=Rhodotorula graminis (strain WP1) TaxID=578459 RepID=A0A194S3B1_RHOGW|nr:uncharacterized protein RHOBADRAFT_66355 [Rhodotorula graminis WP1]KPV75223.1 hypothetical protein RHOBADRAFT_66355 [Rhodotorula graminis WP1]